MRMTATIFVLSWMVWILLLLMRTRCLPLPIDFRLQHLNHIHVEVTLSGVEVEHVRDLKNRLVWLWIPFGGWESRGWEC